jgi:hypothetical protein
MAVFMVLVSEKTFYSLMKSSQLRVYWFKFVYSFWIQVKTLRLAIPKPSLEHALNKRNYFIFIVALLQFGITYFLCRSIFSAPSLSETK